MKYIKYIITALLYVLSVTNASSLVIFIVASIYYSEDPVRWQAAGIIFIANNILLVMCIIVKIWTTVLSRDKNQKKLN